MKKILGILGSLVLLIGVTTSSVSASATCDGKFGVRLYDGKNYTGFGLLICSGGAVGPNIPSLNAPYNFNDRAESIRFYNAANTQIRFYEHVQYGGKYITTTNGGDLPDLSVYWPGAFFDGFANQISSLKRL